MKFGWSKLVDETRRAMLEMTTIEGQNPEHTAHMRNWFKTLMLQTDEFHPAWEDKYLEKAFVEIPDRCDYRSVEKYWAYKRARENCISWMYDYFVQMETLIRDYFCNPMNFEPGAEPAVPSFGDLEMHAEKILPGLLRRIKL